MEARLALDEYRYVRPGWAVMSRGHERNVPYKYTVITTGHIDPPCTDKYIDFQMHSVRSMVHKIVQNFYQGFIFIQKEAYLGP